MFVVAAAPSARTAPAFTAPWSCAVVTGIAARTARSIWFTTEFTRLVSRLTLPTIPSLASQSSAKKITSRRSSSPPSEPRPVASRRTRMTISLTVVQMPWYLTRLSSMDVCSSPPAEHSGRSRFTTVPMQRATAHCDAA